MTETKKEFTLAMICNSCGEPSIIHMTELGTVAIRCQECGGSSLTVNSFPKEES